MDELIPDLVGEKDMKSAWKNKPLKIIGLILLFLIDYHHYLQCHMFYRFHK